MFKRKKKKERISDEEREQIKAEMREEFNKVVTYKWDGRA